MVMCLVRAGCGAATCRTTVARLDGWVKLFGLFAANCRQCHASDIKTSEDAFEGQDTISNCELRKRSEGSLRQRLLKLGTNFRGFFFFSVTTVNLARDFWAGTAAMDRDFKSDKFSHSGWRPNRLRPPFNTGPGEIRERVSLVPILAVSRCSKVIEADLRPNSITFQRGRAL